MRTLYDSAITEAISQDERFNEIAQMLVTLGRALQQVGLPSHRIEQSLIKIAEQFQVPVEVLSFGTGQIISFHRPTGPWTFVLRTQPATADLDRLSQLTVIGERLMQGSITPLAARARVERVMHPTGRPGLVAIVLAYVCSAAAFSVFFGGGWWELVVSTCVGLAVGLIAVAMRRVRQPGRLFELAAAMAAAAIAGTADQVLGAYGGWIPLAAGLIILLPGMALVDALEELASGQLLSGAGRFAGVGVAFLALTFGVIAGYSLTSYLPEVDNVDPEEFSKWAIIPALLVVSVGSLIRFRARVSDWPIILIASVVALIGSRISKAYVGDILGMFLASLLLGVVAGAYSRWSRRPHQLIVVPGLALLVPGSVGYRSLETLAGQDADLAVVTAFQMFMIAMALVAGLLFSNATDSPSDARLTPVVVRRSAAALTGQGLQAGIGVRSLNRGRHLHRRLLGARLRGGLWRRSGARGACGPFGPLSEGAGGGTRSKFSIRLDRSRV